MIEGVLQVLVYRVKLKYRTKKIGEKLRERTVQYLSSSSTKTGLVYGGDVVYYIGKAY